MKIRLDVWLQQHLSPPPSKTTARQWLKRGLIEPAPQKIGSTYYVEKGARFKRDKLKTVEKFSSPSNPSESQFTGSDTPPPVKTCNPESPNNEPTGLDLNRGRETIAQLLESMPTYHLSPGTVLSYRYTDARIRKDLGEIECSKLDVRKVAEYLGKIERTGPNSARGIRSRLFSLCRRGIALGWMTSNPVSLTYIPKPPVKRRRLSLVEFEAILAKGRELNGWLDNAMLLALVSGQDRTTVATWHASCVGEEYAVIRRSKSKVRIAIPLSLTLDAIGMSLKQVLDKCKETGSFEGYYIHRLAGRSLSPGQPHSADWITHEFEQARRLAGLDGPNAPTFHEIRSLAKRLYLEQGNVDTKSLLGHRSESMADLYADSRGGDPLKIYCDRGRPFAGVRTLASDKLNARQLAIVKRPIAAFIRAAKPKKGRCKPFAKTSSE